jgi:hypothetical protein
MQEEIIAKMDKMGYGRQVVERFFEMNNKVSDIEEAIDLI